MVTADDFKDYKKGFNNQYVCFEYPFLWNDIKSEEEDEFTDVVLHDRQHNSIVKISTKPCTFNTVDELKEAVEVELKENNCEIQQSAVESLEKLDIRMGVGLWNILSEKIEDPKILPFFFTALCEMPVEEFNENLREKLYHTAPQSSNPLGFFFCQFQVSLQASNAFLFVFQPSTLSAFEASAYEVAMSPGRRSVIT